MKTLAYIALAICVFLLAVVAGIMIFSPPKPPPVPDPPCEELVWMRDSPQARCVEYWNQQDLKEQQDEQVL